jgi:hypothetical protein
VRHVDAGELADCAVATVATDHIGGLQPLGAGLRGNRDIEAVVVRRDSGDAMGKPNVEIGGIVQFRYSGERTERTGTLVSVTGHGDLAQGVHYAVMPLDEPSTVIATVSLPRTETSAQENSTHECLIGRSARVLLPAVGGGFFDQILRRVF